MHHQPNCNGEVRLASAESKTCGMCGHFLYGNRETRQAPRPMAKGMGVASMKERTRRIDVDANRESDSVVVPKKPPNKEAPASAEAVEERTLAKRNAGEETATRTPSRNVASSGLEGVRRRAKTDKACCFTALLHHITPELLREREKRGQRPLLAW